MHLAISGKQFYVSDTVSGNAADLKKCILQKTSGRVFRLQTLHQALLQISDSASMKDKRVEVSD
jgi:hypothetical protein